MRRSADDDLSTLDQVEARLSGFYPDVVSAPQQRLDLPVDDFYGHRALQGDGLALDRAHGVIGRIVRARRGSREQSAKNRRTRGEPNYAAPQPISMDSSRQSTQLPIIQMQQLQSQRPQTGHPPILYADRHTGRSRGFPCTNEHTNQPAR